MKFRSLFTTITALMLFTVFTLNIYAQEIPHTVLGWHTGSVYSVSFSPDGTLLVSVSEGAYISNIRIWNANTGAHLRTIAASDDVYSLSLSPDGRRLASNHDDHIHISDVNTDIILKNLYGHTGSVNSVTFSPDGTLLASGSWDNTIRLWYVTTGTHLRTLQGHWRDVNSVSFSPDGTLLASGSDDNTIRLWDVETGDELRTLWEHTDYVNSVSFSPDGTLLASGSNDNTIVLWDVETGDELHTLTGHWDSVNSVSFSPDGTLLASGSDDNTIVLWDVETGDELHTLTGHRDSVNSVSFSPDGTFLASGSDDETIRFWELPDTYVNIAVLPVDVPAIGDQLTLSINITEGENVTGYQARVRFDATALRYVSSTNGDYLPDNSFFVDPIVEGGSVLLGASSIDDSSSGDGNLATVTFEFIAIKQSTLTLSSTSIVNSVGEQLGHLHSVDPIVVGVPRLREDVNLDGVVDILDLTLVAASFGKSSRFDPDHADVNEDGIVDIVDLVLVAGALGNTAAAPSVHAQVRRLFTAADINLWLSQAQHLNLIDAQSQRGILFLQQVLAVFTPKKTALLPNYPNPFNPETWIPYQLAAPADVTLTIYAVDGKLVRKLDLGYSPVGIYQNRTRAAYWDGKNDVGEFVASGVYFYTLTAGDFSATRKMLIRK